MSTAESKGETLMIQTFGNFCFYFGEAQRAKSENRSKKVWLLLGLLIANWGETISQEAFIRLLWPDSAHCADPANCLKNLVYRARTLLMELTADPSRDYILFSKGAYTWNTGLSTKLDSIEMEKLFAQAGEPGQSPGTQMACYSQIIRLYQGPFLAGLDGEPWLLEKRSHYESLYIDSIVRYCGLLTEAGRIGEVLSVCQSGLQVCPNAAALHIRLLKGYAAANQYTEALSHYRKALETFQQNGDFPACGLLSDFYPQIARGGSVSDHDLQTIKKELIESAQEPYPFFCDYPVFQQIIRVQLRNQTRSGSVALLLLLNLTGPEGRSLSPEDLEYPMLTLQNCILDSLRSNDVVARYSVSQFIMGLTVSAPEDGRAIARRIRSVFVQRCLSPDMQLSEQIVTLI